MKYQRSYTSNSVDSYKRPLITCALKSVQHPKGAHILATVKGFWFLGELFETHLSKMAVSVAVRSV